MKAQKLDLTVGESIATKQLLICLQILTSCARIKQLCNYFTDGLIIVSVKLTNNSQN